MASNTSATDLESKVSKLSIETPAPKGTGLCSKTKTAAIADSWEDEAISSDSEVDKEYDNSGPSSPEQERQLGRGSGHAGTTAPPPTPMSPTYGKRPFSPTTSGPTFELPYEAPNSGLLGGTTASARPEKTDAVARRMIASALGMKVPRPNEEQRAYDRAVREKERRRREDEKVREKKREEEALKAKQAVWEE
ncbi:hypothetical protein B0T26DRAFT_741269 [Lasiosphaeria miniovina]|uniref:Ubiquitin smt3 n=1 Tax=Lasiosphaeria miniovina TaxID=1954250 RepID=A0AA40E0K1_9PEZI|nr:uncharacterized protein B0T26DRAFT_741269 [Lasiosphaeria miniovina]KAK0718233.1 hypothetical protein B0T26DRAFT_741269 [Lasiosphaeria miniovina]